MQILKKSLCCSSTALKNLALVILTSANVLKIFECILSRFRDVAITFLTINNYVNNTSPQKGFLPWPKAHRDCCYSLEKSHCKFIQISMFLSVTNSKHRFLSIKSVVIFFKSLLAVYLKHHLGCSQTAGAILWLWL